MPQKGMEAVKRMNPTSRFIVALASTLLTVAYLIFAGLGAAAIVVWSEQFGVRALNPVGGMALFTVVITIELTLVMVFNKPAPFILLFGIPVVIAIIAMRQVYSSEMIRETLKRLESRVRTSPVPLPFK